MFSTLLTHSFLEVINRRKLPTLIGQARFFEVLIRHVGPSKIDVAALAEIYLQPNIFVGFFPEVLRHTYYVYLAFKQTRY